LHQDIRQQADICSHGQDLAFSAPGWSEGALRGGTSHHAVAPATPGKFKLSGIEAARGIAAATVVFYHAARHLGQNYGPSVLLRLFQFGHAGVDLFFVISGFIILYVHFDDIGRPDRFGRYLARRLTRIYPTYWVALVLTVAMSFLGGLHGAPPWDRVVASVLLAPSSQAPLLGVAWTLQYEVFFYALFGILILHRRLGFAILLIWIGGIVGSQFGQSAMGAIPNAIYNAFNFEFLLGMATAYLLRRHRIPAPRLVLGLGIALFVTAAAFENAGLFNGYSDVSRLLYGLPAAMIVGGSAELDRLGLLNVPPALLVLGKASYSIYLFQFVFIGIVWKAWLLAGLDTKLPHLASFPLLATAGVAGGVIMSRLVEYPLINLIRTVKRARANA
jgi:peptidoglycan/LPS O-acetylase OafA/YrhL